jgi:hypothetical protein
LHTKELLLPAIRMFMQAIVQHPFPDWFFSTHNLLRLHHR